MASLRSSGMSDKQGAIETVIEQLCSEETAKLRREVSIAGRLLPATYGGAGSVLPPIEVTHCLGVSENNPERSIYFSALCAIYGLQDMYDDVDGKNLTMYGRVHVDTQEALSTGVRLLEKAELPLASDARMTIVVMFEAPTSAWPKIRKWRYAFGLTFLSGHLLHTEQTYCYEALTQAHTWNVELAEMSSYALAGGKRVVTCQVGLNAWHDWFDLPSLPENVLACRTRVTSLPPRATDVIPPCHATCRQDSSYRLDRVMCSRVSGTDTGKVVMFDEGERGNMRALRELVCTDVFADQLKRDASLDEEPERRDDLPKIQPRVGSAISTGIFATWLCSFAARCNFDFDCMCVLNDMLLTCHGEA